MMKFNSKTKTILMVCCLSVVCAAIGIAMLVPGKVLDPHDPRFDITKFRYEDYSRYSDNQERVGEVLRVFFPEGTDRKYMEDVLVKSGSVVAGRHGSYSERGTFGFATDKTISDASVNVSDYAVYFYSYRKKLFSFSPGRAIPIIVLYDSDQKAQLIVSDGYLVYPTSILSAPYYDGRGVL